MEERMDQGGIERQREREKERKTGKCQTDNLNYNQSSLLTT